MRFRQDTCSGAAARVRPRTSSRDDEIHQLLVSARHLGPPGSLRPHTYSTLFGLLAVTGMRVAEALALQYTDVTSDGLHIRHSKFQKSRLLPLHATTRAALEQYLTQRQRVAGTSPHLFVSRRHGQLSRTVVTQTFHQVLTSGRDSSAPGPSTSPAHGSPAHLCRAGLGGEPRDPGARSGVIRWR